MGEVGVCVCVKKKNFNIKFKFSNQSFLELLETVEENLSFKRVTR